MDHLADDRAAVAVQSEGRIAFAIASDRPLSEVAAQLTELMQGEIDARTWAQTWDGPDGPPQLRQVG